MLYRTIVMNLIESNPPLHNQLRRARRLLSEINRLSGEMASIHRSKAKELEAMGMASQAASSAAMESAVQDMQALLSGSPVA